MQVRTKFQLIDVALSTFLFTPLVCLFWHGLFGVLDILVLKDFPITGPWIITVVGTVLQIVISCIQKDIVKFVSKRPYDSQKKYLLGYNLLLATAQIMQFRGLNDIYENFIGVGAYDAIKATCTAIVLLCSLRLCTQVVDMPFTLSLDSEATAMDGFRFDSYYNTEPGFHSSHIIDSACTVGLIQSFVLLFNIASWIAVHVIFFPHNAFLAMSSSWILGHGVTLGLLYYLPQIKTLVENAVKTDVPIVGRLFMDIVFIVQGIGVVMSWHGHFELYDVLHRNFPITHAGMDVTSLYEVLAAFTLLSLCHISSVLVRRGITFDEVDSSVNSLTFDANYFAHFFNKEITEREKEEREEEDDGATPGKYEVNGNIIKKSTAPRNVDDMTRLRRQVSLQNLVENDKKKRDSKKKHT